MDTIDNITLTSREYEFNSPSIEPLEIDEDPSGLLRGGVGSTIWDTAIVLAKYFERSNTLASRLPSGTAEHILHILELGSGTGIVGLAVARMLSAKGVKAKVFLTDKENCMPLLQRNIGKNPSKGVDVIAQMLDWETFSGAKAKSDGASGTDSDIAAAQDTASSEGVSNKSNRQLGSIGWDIVILSDCIWVPALYPPLIGTLNNLVKSNDNGTQLVLAYEKRNFAEEMEFFAMLGKTFRFRDVKPEEQDPNYQSEDIYLFLCQHQ
ncbi:hypothetical protein BGZ51_006902 [Haplosporangium sp. Z 767]|nr:hypothetical protein BGZ51_006902 [Haplosporangium sp. Z 767]KAF9179493.1 hypothetical protein BGZ50_006884 [Haplosporangium sp. Z 11]